MGVRGDEIISKMILDWTCVLRSLFEQVSCDAGRREVAAFDIP